MCEKNDYRLDVYALIYSFVNPLNKIFEIDLLVKFSEGSNILLTLQKICDYFSETFFNK
ncbi:MAG: hypothetical protein H6Q16_563 [Bacteroidetes bacterium]|nr:hypothetical protein [Bacteroidota bacterium]